MSVPKFSVSPRLAALLKRMKSRRLDLALVYGQANIRVLVGVDCDAACLAIVPGESPSLTFFTDFRYVPMVHRVAPGLKTGDLRKMCAALRSLKPRRIGYESKISQARFAALQKAFKRVKFVDVGKELSDLRAVKTPEEIVKMRASEKLVADIWNEVRVKIRPGMTEREIARMIRHRMIDLGEGESFETIVCAGENAAECHHVPDDTVWDGKCGLLVDMGVTLDGYASDLTRNLLPKRKGMLYRKVFGLVKSAHDAAIAAARPGITAGKLDAIARGVIRKGGFGKCFGHSLGHGVGLEIHEAPTARKGDRTVLKPGMLVTIEPGIYLEGNLGVRIEDLILITGDGCEVLSQTAVQECA